MQKRILATIVVIAVVLVTSCNKRQVPQQTTATSTSTTAPAVKKPVVKKVVLPVPRVIAVNDKVAKKNIDGRLYYDLNGHRYWRNYNDGKYYLFNQSMYSDSAFIPH